MMTSDASPIAAATAYARRAGAGLDHHADNAAIAAV
jgi:hypothetical protein